MKTRTKEPEVIKLRVRAVAEANHIDDPGSLAAFLGISRSMADRLWDGAPFPRMEKLAIYAGKFGVPMASLYEELGAVLPSRQKRPQKNGRKAIAT